MDQEYDYTAAGFDGFLSRSIDNTPRVNLAGQGPQTTAQAYDRTQVSGMLGDTLQIGGVRISREAITINDGQNDFLIMGDDGSGSAN